MTRPLWIACTRPTRSGWKRLEDLERENGTRAVHRYRTGIVLGVGVALISLALTSTTVEAQGRAGGYPVAAKLCQSDWQTLQTTDGASFKNMGQCVRYAARGGEFAPPDPWAAQRAFCSSLGGSNLVFQERNDVTVWLCMGTTHRPPEDEVDYTVFCTGRITTEERQGQTVLVCTPSS